MSGGGSSHFYIPLWCNLGVGLGAGSSRGLRQKAGDKAMNREQ